MKLCYNKLCAHLGLVSLTHISYTAIEFGLWICNYTLTDIWVMITHPYRIFNKWIAKLLLKVGNIWVITLIEHDGCTYLFTLWYQSYLFRESASLIFFVLICWGMLCPGHFHDCYRGTSISASSWPISFIIVIVTAHQFWLTKYHKNSTLHLTSALGTQK